MDPSSPSQLPPSSSFCSFFSPPRVRPPARVRKSSNRSERNNSPTTSPLLGPTPTRQPTSASITARFFFFFLLLLSLFSLHFWRRTTELAESAILYFLPSLRRSEKIRERAGIRATTGENAIRRFRVASSCDVELITSTAFGAAPNSIRDEDGRTDGRTLSFRSRNRRFKTPSARRAEFPRQQSRRSRRNGEFTPKFL